jgi:hypothetical protein
MQIKFLTLCHDFDDRELSLYYAQDSLLYMWQRSIQLKQIKFIPSAKVEFKEYSFFDYPDQEKAKREIQNVYGNKRKKKDGGGDGEYYWCGTQYSDLDTIYEALSKEKHFMELTITVDDEDYV